MGSVICDVVSLGMISFFPLSVPFVSTERERERERERGVGGYWREWGERFLKTVFRAFVHWNYDLLNTNLLVQRIYLFLHKS